MLILQDFVLSRDFRIADSIRTRLEISRIILIVVCDDTIKRCLGISKSLFRIRFCRLGSFVIRKCRLILFHQIGRRIGRDILFYRHADIISGQKQFRVHEIKLHSAVFRFITRPRSQGSGVVIGGLCRFQLFKFSHLRVGCFQLRLHSRFDLFALRQPGRLIDFREQQFRLSKFGACPVRHPDEAFLPIDRLEIAHAFFDHFFFEESQLGFIGCFGRRVLAILAAAVVRQ